MTRPTLVILLLLSPMPWAALRAADGGIASHYNDQAKRLMDGALSDQHSLERFEYLCDRIGNRLSGSASLERAITWAVDAMKDAGLSNVRTQPVKVPHWVRGSEAALMVAPLERKLPMLGLGNSVGTGPDGVTGDVVVVSNFDELNGLGAAAVRGKIVLFDAPYEGYGRTVMYRVAGASRAAALGAQAVLVRSVTPLAMRTPHTGTLQYTANDPKIPAAALTIEDAESIHRLIKSGVPVKVHLQMSAHFEPDADSFNVIGEIPGREKPEEVVAIGGHIDSWDVGQGAQDDGSGIMASLEAASLIHRMGLHPRRTIRVVFWVNEENGGAGGKAYRESLGDEVRNQVAAIEMDGGAEKPVGFGAGPGEFRAARIGAPRRNAGTEGHVAELSPAAMQRLKEIGSLLAPIGADQIRPGGGGSDIEPIMEAGVPGLSELSTAAHYFDWHHTEADTFDKINPQDFRESVASMAVMSFVLADMPERLLDMK